MMLSDTCLSFFGDVASSTIGGLIGAFVAAAITICMDFRNRNRAAQEKLRDLLISTKDFGFTRNGNHARNYIEEYRANYPAILSAYLTYKSYTLPPHREALEQAWKAYRGTKRKPDSEDTILADPIDVSGEREFYERTTNFIKFLTV
jgi:hypothetical protein